MNGVNHSAGRRAVKGAELLRQLPGPAGLVARHRLAEVVHVVTVCQMKLGVEGDEDWGYRPYIAAGRSERRVPRA